MDDYIENAIEWAMRRLGAAEYRLRCLAFVEDAYERGNHIEIFGGDSAGESAVQYGADQHTDAPPRGTFVFYACSGPIAGVMKNWGHVGLSLGDGDVIHAWDIVRIDSYLDVPFLKPAPQWTEPTFVGWVPVERILLGAQLRVWN